MPDQPWERAADKATTDLREGLSCKAWDDLKGLSLGDLAHALKSVANQSEQLMQSTKQFPVLDIHAYSKTPQNSDCATFPPYICEPADVRAEVTITDPRHYDHRTQILSFAKTKNEAVVNCEQEKLRH